jgi:hypothetical protein
MNEIAWDTVIARSASVVTSVVDGEVLMMSIEQGRYFSLNDVATEVWNRLETPLPFRALVDELAGAYDATPERVRADVESLLREMEARDAVELRPAPA